MRIEYNSLVGVSLLVLANGTLTALDTDDFLLYGSFKWALSNAYPATVINRHSVYLHRIVCKALRGQTINGNKLDNRKINLRVVTRTGNSLNSVLRRDNTTGFKGVSIVPHSGAFRAMLQVNGVRVLDSCHGAVEEAALVYDAAVLKFTETGALNFPSLSKSRRGVR